MLLRSSAEVGVQMAAMDGRDASVRDLALLASVITETHSYPITDSYWVIDETNDIGYAFTSHVRRISHSLDDISSKHQVANIIDPSILRAWSRQASR